MRAIPLPIPALEIALLRRGVGDRSGSGERCRDCRRLPLIGEYAYRYDSDTVCCELCRAVRHEEPASRELVHGPEHGHAVRVIRVAAAG